MMKTPRVSLEQWRVLQAVVDHGGFAQAAQHLHRSQSSVSYTVAKLQDQLGMRLLYIEGRKARLSEAGKVLLRRSKQLIQEAVELEQLAGSLEQGWEPEIRLAVDQAFPQALLMTALQRFAPLSRGTRVLLNEVVLSGSDEALLEGRADLAIGGQVPQGYLGEMLVEVQFVAVAHPDHPLHQLQHPLTMNELRQQMQVVIHDSGVHQKRDVGWLGAERRWTVTNIDTAITLVSHGLGFAWLPRQHIQDQLAAAALKPLPLRQGQIRSEQLHLIFGQADHIGPATQALAYIIRQLCT